VLLSHLRSAAVCGLVFLAATSVVSVAGADTHVSLGADPFDDDVFRTLAESARVVEVRAAVATDIDQDGDIDLVANTNTGLVVWVNDGAGHFETQPPRQAPVTHGEEPATSWSSGDLRRPESITTSGVSTPLITCAAHAPLAETSRLLDGSRTQAAMGRDSGLFAPRAPPALS
jgi:VCBS repeat protein